MELVVFVPFSLALAGLVILVYNFIHRQNGGPLPQKRPSVLLKDASSTEKASSSEEDRTPGGEPHPLLKYFRDTYLNPLIIDA